MKKLILLFILSFALLSCSSASLTQAEDSVQVADQRLDQSSSDPSDVVGTPDEVQLQQGEEQSEVAEGYQDDDSVDDTGY
jgi:uncharacterized protein YcfL